MSCFFSYVICCNILPAAIVKEDGLGLNDKMGYFWAITGKRAWRPDAHALQMHLFPELAYNAFQTYSHTYLLAGDALLRYCMLNWSFLMFSFLPMGNRPMYVCGHDWSWHGLERPRHKSIFIHIALWVAYGQLYSLNSI